jgi:hypothetical protein
MPRPRVPTRKAIATGRVLHDPKRFQDRNEPAFNAPLGEAPKWFKTQEQVDAWKSFRDELPWLNKSHRALVGIACEIRGRLNAGEDVGVNPSLARAFLTGRWIYFAPRLDRLRYFGKSSAFTCRAFDFCDDIFSFRLFHMNHSLGMRNDTLTPSSAPALHAPYRYAELKSYCRHPNQW